MIEKTSSNSASDVYASSVVSDKPYDVNFTHCEIVFPEPEALERGGGPKPLSAAERVLRFWSKVKRTPDACWEWQGGTFQNGYGMFAAGRRAGKAYVRTAHRTAYELTHGLIPDGLQILHACDNRVCCNPAHMSLGTSKDNMADARQKGRMGGLRPRQVTPEMVEAILTGPRGTQTRLAKETGIKLSTLQQAVYTARKRRQRREQAA